MLKHYFQHTKSITLPLTMTRHILILVVFFSFLGVVLAQEKIITVQVIIDDEQEEHPGSVYILNQRSNLSVMADTGGRAKVAVRTGDFLYFASDFYYNQSAIVSAVSIEKGWLTVSLKPKIVELEEAVLGFRLTGNLAKDAKNAGFKDSVSMIYGNIGIREVDAPPPNPNGRPAGEGMIAEKLIGSITGYNKKQKNKFAYEEQQKKLSRIRDYFGDEYLEKELKIPNHKIPEFIFFVHETSNIFSKVESNHFMEAEGILKEKSKIYLQRSDE